MMRLGVLGTGMVGRALATRFSQLGHEVRIGSRSPDGEAAQAWAAEHGAGASAGSFGDAAAFGEVVINATRGAVALDALALAGAAHLAGKVLIDVSNPLAEDEPGVLTVANTDSLAESIQRAYPDAHVVKALNTMNCAVMVAPDLVEGSHVVFVCGDRDGAKRTAVALLGRERTSALRRRRYRLDHGRIREARRRRPRRPAARRARARRPHRR